MKISSAFIVLAVVSSVMCEAPTWITCAQVQSSIQNLAEKFSCLKNDQKALGSGSTGVTYVLQNKNGLQVVAKTVAYDTAQSKEQGDMEVAVLTAAGGKKNVVKFYGSAVATFTQGTVLIVVQEYCSYGTLESFHKSFRSYFYDGHFVMRIFRDIVIGVQQVHLSGYVHADLKIANAVVNADKVGMVIDFDLSNLINKPGDVKGSPLYMDSRLIVDNNYFYDEKTDVYSLGIMLYELLTDTTPFNPMSMPDLISKTKAGSFKIPKGMERSIALIIIRCIQYTPANRPTISELLDLINAYFAKTENNYVAEITVSNKKIISENSFSLTATAQKTPIIFVGNNRRGLLLSTATDTKPARDPLAPLVYIAIALLAVLIIKMIAIWFDGLRSQVAVPKTGSDALESASVCLDCGDLDSGLRNNIGTVIPQSRD